MSKRPHGWKYRNLHLRNDRSTTEWFYGGRRHRFSCKTRDWDEAAATRDLYEKEKGVGRFVLSLRVAPTFADFAQQYLDEDRDDLAPTTLTDRCRELGSAGPILSHLGSRRLDEIDEFVLREWWTAEVMQKGRATKTGRNLLDSLSAVFRYAAELKFVDVNPVDRFRLVIRRKRRTQRGRAEADSSKDVRPIGDPRDIEVLLTALGNQVLRPKPRRGSLPDPSAARELPVYALLMLDAGLRSVRHSGSDGVQSLGAVR